MNSKDISMHNHCPMLHLEGILPSRRITCINNILLLLGIYFIATLPYPISAIAPKYETAYACEGKTLIIECEAGDLINLIRANYGRFSITICNDHGNVDWSVNCMSAKSLRVLHSKCAHKPNCSVLASTNMFGDPCPGTHKYLEAHYQCVSAAQTSTTTNRPSPPWLITSQPSVWSTSTIRLPTTTRGNNVHHHHDGGGGVAAVTGSNDNKSISSSVATSQVNSKSVVGIKFKPTTIGGSGSSTASSATTTTIQQQQLPTTIQTSTSSSNVSNSGIVAAAAQPAIASSSSTVNLHAKNQTNQQIDTQSTTISVTLIGENGLSSSDIYGKSAVNNNNPYSTQSTVHLNNNVDQFFCGPRTARNLFWNLTRVGEVNVQPCPGGATGIAKWRCVYANQLPSHYHSSGSASADSDNAGGSGTNFDTSDIESIGMMNDDSSLSTNLDGTSSSSSSSRSNSISSGGSSNSNGGQMSSTIAAAAAIQVVWQPLTPDLTHCRSLWLNSLEVRVNQRDSSLISIANDLSQVTSSKTLYGGDMLVTTKIIQIMSEKMTYDIETFPDQRQREAIVMELLHGVVKTGSNLLDSTQLLSWLDLSFEDQMRVATSLLTGLEDNAFLLADTIIRERNVVQKVKNILLSVRVLETRNIVGNEIFPDATVEQWHVSDDSIELPRGALIENSEGGLVRIVFVAFDRLESILKPADSWSEFKYSINSGATINNNHSQSSHLRNRVLNSKVISASLGKGRHIQLSQPIRLILKHLKTENVSNPMCVFWNYIDHAWSEDGCYVETTNKTHTICMCNHLTNFAILMDIIDDSGNSILSIFDDNIRLLIYISVAICIALVIIALLTLKLFNGIFVKSSRTTIYKNLYICLLVIELLFLFGIEQSETSILCGFTTAFLHCAFLCAVAWLFFEGFQLYVTLTTEEILLEVEKSSRIIWYYLMTYGLSFTIVAISLAIDPGSYTQADYCLWTESNYLFYFTFVAPIFIYILGTLAYSAMSIYKMCKKYKTSLKNKEHTRLASVSGFEENCIQEKIKIHQFYLRCSFIFLLIFIGCWTFAYIYLIKVRIDSPTANIYGYTFVILNAMQGFYIFGFHCINNEKIRREYRKYVRQQSWLPKCLRCSKNASITSTSPNNQQQQQQVASGVGGNNITSSPIIGNMQSGIDGGGSSGMTVSCTSGGGMAGTLTRHYQSGTMAGGIKIGGNHRHNIIVERIGNDGMASGTMRGINGQISPSSSAGSTHLIYNAATQPDVQQDWSHPHFTNYNLEHQQKQQTQHNQLHQTELVNKNLNNFDDKFLYYDRKNKKIKQQQQHPTSLSSSSASSSPRQQQPPQQQQQQPHEYFYWTEKLPTSHQQQSSTLLPSSSLSSYNNKHRKMPMINGDLGTGGIPIGKSDTMHIVYPSYKKKLMYYSHSPSHPSLGVGDDKLIIDSDSVVDDFHKDHQHLHHYHHQQQQQQQPQHESNHQRYLRQQRQHIQGSDDDENIGIGEHYQHHPYRQQHKRKDQMISGGGGNSRDPRFGYYNQSSSISPNGSNYLEEPVYEEILSNRLTDSTTILPIASTSTTTTNATKHGFTVDHNHDGDGEDDANDDENDDDDDDEDDGVVFDQDGYRIRDMLNLKEDMILRQSSSRPLIKSAYDFQTHSSSVQQQSQMPSMHHHHHHNQSQQQQQQQIGRNLSAMLDENNTVICYLEPMTK